MLVLKIRWLEVDINSYIGKKFYSFAYMPSYEWGQVFLLIPLFNQLNCTNEAMDDKKKVLGITALTESP